MKTPLGLLTLLLLATTAAAQPDLSKQYSRPTVPPREVLDRLALKLGWQTYVPMDGRRDGLASVQVTPKEILVQTRSGLIVSLDPETGRTNWRQRVGNPYAGNLPPGYNGTQVF